MSRSGKLSGLRPAAYLAMRERLGSRRDVGRALGVPMSTLKGREAGFHNIDIESGLALRYLDRHGLHAHPTARLESHATPGELREAFRILGWSGTEAARILLGAGEYHRKRVSAMMTGDVVVSERVARLVKVRLGLEVVDPWPKRGAMAWPLSLPDGMEGME